MLKASIKPSPEIRKNSRLEAVDSYGGKIGRQMEQGIMIAKGAGALLPQDLITLSSVLKVCDMDTVVLGAHLKAAAIDSEVVGDSIFCHIETDFSFRGRFAIPADWCLLGYLHDANHASGCNGTPISSGTAFTVFPGGSSEFVFGADSCAYIMLLPLQRLRQKFAQLVHPDLDIPARLLAMFNLSGSQLGATLSANFQKVHQHLFRDVRENAVAGPLIEKELDTLLENHLLAGLSAQSDDRPHCSRGRRAHYQIVQRAEHYMRENLRRVIYLDELCKAAGVSERALRYAFDDLLGLSPNRYLSMLRLCTAFRALSTADASRRSVKSVALSCGLWDLSRFADHYRHTFGELPRDTLMRAPPAEPTSPFAAREMAYH
jgi:AraC family ethanolamine operon transcriptional activator